MAKRKRQSKNKAGFNFTRTLIIITIITGLAALVIRMLNRRLKIEELGEIAGICGTIFVVCLLILVGIWVLKNYKK